MSKATNNVLGFDLGMIQMKGASCIQQSLATLSSPATKLDSETRHKQKLHCFVPCSIEMIHFLCQRLRSGSWE